MCGYAEPETVQRLKWLYRSNRKRETNDEWVESYYYDKHEIDWRDELTPLTWSILKDRHAGYTLAETAKRNGVSVNKTRKLIKWACRLTAKAVGLHPTNGGSIPSSPTT